MPLQLLRATRGSWRSSAYRHNTTTFASFSTSSLWVRVSLGLGPTQIIQNHPELFLNRVTLVGSGNQDVDIFFRGHHSPHSRTHLAPNTGSMKLA